MPKLDAVKKKISILALDVATHCGWAVRGASGVWDLQPKRDESAGMRIVRFKAKVLEVCDAEKISIIVFERSAGMHKASIIVQSELHGVLKLFCEERNITYKGYSASEIKKYATGKGNAKKDQMVSAAREKYGYKGSDDNEADALHLLHLAISDLML